MSGLAGSIRLTDPLAGIADVRLHELGLGQAHALDGVGRQKAVLHVEERRLRGLGGAAGDQAEIAGLLALRPKIMPQPQSATDIMSS